MCDLDLDDDYCSLWEENIVKAARKEHRCWSCAGTISKGASYRRHFSIFQGDVNHQKTVSRLYGHKQSVSRYTRRFVYTAYTHRRSCAVR